MKPSAADETDFVYGTIGTGVARHVAVTVDR